MPPPGNKSCGNCKYHGPEEHPFDGKVYSQCRVKAPAFSSVGITEGSFTHWIGQWPYCTDTDWCGEWDQL